MAKILALNASFSLDDSSGATRSLSGRNNNITLGQTAEAPEVTTFGDVTREHLPDGLKNWELRGDFFYDSAANQVDAVFSGVLGASTVFLLGPSGSAGGSVKYSACCILTDYSIALGVANAATVSITLTPRSGSLTRGTF